MSELHQFAMPEQPLKDQEELNASGQQDMQLQAPFLRGYDELAIAAEALALNGEHSDLLANVRLLRDLHVKPGEEGASDSDAIGLSYFGSQDPKEYRQDKNRLIHSLDAYAHFPDTPEKNSQVAIRILEELFGSSNGERAA